MHSSLFARLSFICIKDLYKKNSMYIEKNPHILYIVYYVNTKQTKENMQAQLIGNLSKHDGDG